MTVKAGPVGVNGRNETRRDSSPEERRRLREMTQEYTIAVAENERRERQVAALYELWRSVPETETHRLLQRIAERAAAALDGHTCSLMLRERGGDTLRIAASVGLPQDVADSVTLLVGERIAGRVAATGQPVLINKDPNQHPLLAGDGEQPAATVARRPEVESSLCCPLVAADGAVLGVLCLSRFVPATPFSESDLRMLCLFAGQAGSVIAQKWIIEDLTRAAEEGAELEREIARTSSLAALGQLAATVAHELRNPLSSIKGAAQFLLRECADATDERSAMLRDFLSIVVEEVNGLGQLTTDLVEFARPTPPRRERHDLLDVIRSEVSFLCPELADYGVEVLQQCYEVKPPAWVDVDPKQIGQTLRNLLLNAAQAITAKGEGIPPEITIRVQARPGWYDLSVEDNGPGIPDEVRERLWEPFFTTKARGSGLGLAQVRRVIESHGGTIRVENLIGSGACFTLSLPAAGEER
jgi:signal transduction histidine kinase